MPQTLRQSLPDDADGWLTIACAGEVSGVPLRTLRRRAEREALNARRECRPALARLAAPPSGRGKRVWWVHRSVHPGLQRPSNGHDAERVALLSRFPQHQVERAFRKHRWLTEWRKLCDSRRDSSVTEAELAGRIIDQARSIEGDDYSITFRSLQRWHQAHSQVTDNCRIVGVEGLIDLRAIVNGARGDNTPDGHRGASVTRSPSAIDYFFTLYYTQSELTLKKCHRMTCHQSNKKGWSWSRSYAATLKWVRRTENRSMTCLMRKGDAVWRRRFMPHLEVDYTLIAPGDLYVCDHTQCDFWVADGERQIRPWLTAIMDCRSRCVVGWHFGPSPHTEAILSAMLGAFQGWAVPARMRIDNGKDFTSKIVTGVTKATRDELKKRYGAEWQRVLKRDADLLECVDSRFTGIVPELGIELVYAIPYSPWSKGEIERWFGTFHDQCGKSFATYCGRNTLSRPECLAAIRSGYTKDQKRALRARHGRDWKKHAVLRIVDQSAVPTMDQARAAIGEWIETYHYTEHSGDGMDGQTPLGVWRTAESLRCAGDQELLFLMQTRGIYRVGRNGVHFKVGTGSVAFGQGEPALYPYTGRDVFITMDPANTSHCFAFTADRHDRRFIARLESNERISPKATTDELRQAMARVEHRRKIARQAAREAPGRSRNVAQEVAAYQRERLSELRATGTDGDARQAQERTRSDGV